LVLKFKLNTTIFKKIKKEIRKITNYLDSLLNIIFYSSCLKIFIKKSEVIELKYDNFIFFEFKIKKENFL
jgi:hypothetical protein